MPLYEYKCLKCGHREERIEKVAGPHLSRCSKCGGKVERVLAPAAIQFKGSGWYVTDYARKGTGASAKAEKAEKKEAKDSGPVKEAKKPAATSTEK